MINTLFGYYGLGLSALNAARLGMAVAGDNIANVNTPGYSRRRLDLASGFPYPVPGGQLDMGVDPIGIRRQEDRFVQASLERERGTFGKENERLRGLSDVESIYGTLDGDTIAAAYSEFSNAFSELTANPEDMGLRRDAIGASERLAGRIRETYGRLQAQRRTEDGAAAAAVAEINSLADQLATLNQQIHEIESDGTTAALQRDQRDRTLERLVELTGGTVAAAENGKVTFALPGGPTLVTSEHALLLKTGLQVDGLTRILASDGTDLTPRLRGGKLGALLELRDETLAGGLADLDTLAADLITRANALTTAARDRNGDPGIALFQPDPAPVPGAALFLRVSSAVLADAAKLAVSASGNPGDGIGAAELANIQSLGSAALGGISPTAFLAERGAKLGNDVLRADVGAGVSRGVLETLETRRQSISGVSLDEEAVELLRFQSSFEAAARFIQVLNEVTEVAVNLV